MSFVRINNCFWPTLMGALLLWCALPPLGFWPLAWLAPVPWAWLIALPKLPPRREASQPANGTLEQAARPRWYVRWMLWHRPLGQVYWAGFGFWLATLYWLTLPHWAGALGWIALSWYLAFYFPCFIGTARLLVHRWKLPLPLASAVVWTACEFVRGHFLGGFTMASLGHTQYLWSSLIQISDLVGAYGVSFVVMFCGSAIATALPSPLWKTSADRAETSPLPAATTSLCWVWPATAVALLAGVLGYGYWRLGQTWEQPGEKVRVALIQGSFDTTFEPDPGRSHRIHERYLELTRSALEEFGPVDLVVWPETMFGPRYYTFAEESLPPPGMSVGEYLARRHELLRGQEKLLQWTLRGWNCAFLTGINIDHYGPHGLEDYNAALLISSEANEVARYDKMHPVMFGEYIPLGDYFPWLYDFSPMSGPLKPGSGPVAMPIKSLLLAPSVCFESVLPQVIRGHVARLTQEGREPDALVNVTNDGWFYGSSELDLHLICGVFRAVENRKPLLVAANTGFSAWIDQHGKLQAKGPRRAEGKLLAEVGRHRGVSHYVLWGDWLAGICLALSAGALAVATVQRLRPDLANGSAGMS